MPINYRNYLEKSREIVKNRQNFGAQKSAFTRLGLLKCHFSKIRQNSSKIGVFGAQKLSKSAKNRQKSGFSGPKNRQKSGFRGPKNHEKCPKIGQKSGSGAQKSSNLAFRGLLEELRGNTSQKKYPTPPENREKSGKNAKNRPKIVKNRGFRGPKIAKNRGKIVRS